MYYEVVETPHNTYRVWLYFNGKAIPLDAVKLLNLISIWKGADKHEPHYMSWEIPNGTSYIIARIMSKYNIPSYNDYHNINIY